MNTSLAKLLAFFLSWANSSWWLNQCVFDSNFTLPKSHNILELKEQLAEKIKNSQLEILKECGHMIIFEKAFEMREIVKNFVEKNHK